MKPRPPSNPQNLDDLMVMAEDFAGFSLRSGRQIPPTLLAVTKKGPLFFTPPSLQDDRSKDDFADTARLICIAYQTPAAVMILESWMKMAAEGEIYSAIRGSQQERVALKVFNTDVSQDRARAELRAAQAIDSPYAERVESLGHWRGERFFLAMNLVDGPSLRQEIQAKKLPVAERFVEVAQALLQAGCQLHSRTVDGKPAALLHNDIKPDNILLRAENHPVLIDFGVASAPGVATYVGTEGYVAPDLRNGADLEFCPSGDLFALGVTLFEWLYGVTPYETTIVGASCRDVSNLRDQPLPCPLHQWLVEAVATTKAKRFASADDMLQSLTHACLRA